MKKADALAPFLAQMKQLQQIAGTLGLTLDLFGIIIPPNGDLELVEYQTQLTIRPEAVLSEAEREQVVMDAQFAQIERGEKEREQREEQIPRLLSDIDAWIREDDKGD